ncbi:MAG: hypothetical protein AAF447_27735, partial [Myxococcota bacterium]
RAIAARAALAEGDVERAFAYASEALDRLRRAGGIDEDRAETYLAFIAAAKAAGHQEQAERARTEARSWLEATARRIEDTGLRASFLSNIPAHRALARAAVAQTV